MVSRARALSRRGRRPDPPRASFPPRLGRDEHLRRPSIDGLLEARALPLAAAHLPEAPGLLWRLYAFGDHVHVEGVSEGRYGAHHLRTPVLLGPRGHAEDEGAVDLQGVDVSAVEYAFERLANPCRFFVSSVDIRPGC